MSRPGSFKPERKLFATQVEGRSKNVQAVVREYFYSQESEDFNITLTTASNRADIAVIDATRFQANLYIVVHLPKSLDPASLDASNVFDHLAICTEDNRDMAFVRANGIAQEWLDNHPEAKEPSKQDRSWAIAVTEIITHVLKSQTKIPCTR